MQPFRINLINSLVFIVCGIIGFTSHYVTLGNYEQTALIPCVLGTLLLVMTPSMKSGSVVISRVVTVLTLLFGIVVFILLLTGMGSDKVTARRMILLTVIALSNFSSLGLYLNSWMEERKKG